MAMSLISDIAARSTAPSHTHISEFLSTLLPSRPLDVNFTYHSPRRLAYKPSASPAAHIILSITPTAGVYSALTKLPRRSNPVCFLHRPWSLERRRVPKDALVIASHKTFDELLTVGWNPVLASRLGFMVSNEAICVQGYKNDPDRKIGLLAPCVLPAGMSLAQLWDRIRLEFDDNPDCQLFEHGSVQVNAIAIMNAFHPEEVERVCRAATEAKLATGVHRILYLTGQVRELGLEAAKAIGMPVVCVGHRACEEWGIRFLAAKLGDQYPGQIQIQVILEEEEAQKRPMWQSVTEDSTQQTPILVAGEVESGPVKHEPQKSPPG